MFISHGVWLLRTKGIRKRAKQAGMAYDEFPEAIDWQEKCFKFNWKGIMRRGKSDPEEGQISNVDILQIAK